MPLSRLRFLPEGSVETRLVAVEAITISIYIFKQIRDDCHIKSMEFGSLYQTSYFFSCHLWF